MCAMSHTLAKRLSFCLFLCVWLPDPTVENHADSGANGPNDPTRETGCRPACAPRYCSYFTRVGYRHASFATPRVLYHLTFQTGSRRWRRTNWKAT